MTSEWYCRIMGEEWGPMSAVELIAVARWGRLSRDDVVRRGNQGTWVRAELVKGLFNSPPVAATVTSDRLVAAARRAAPAKRSLRKTTRSQYWVNVDGKVSGPFSSGELRNMAEQGALKPTYKISKDREHWLPAKAVKGLTFGGVRSRAETMPVQSAARLVGTFVTVDNLLAEVL